MGNRTVHFCDFCQKEFGVVGTNGEPMKVAKLVGNRHTNAAGQGDQNEITLEMHSYCWKKFLNKLADEVGV